MKKSMLLSIVVILCAALLWSAVYADENAALYLQDRYGIEFKGEVSLSAFNDALTALGAEPLEGESLTLADAAAAAVRLAGMEELALALAGEADPYLACAQDLGLVSGGDPSDPVTAETAAEMLYRAAEISGKGRRYIGHISDREILSEVREMIDSVIIFDDPVLNEAGINILVSDAATGYSLKAARYNTQFIESNTIRYGHDNAGHLMQLIGLLKSKGFDAYVQIEPKVSVYEYMPEWGEPGPATPTYAVREMTEGRYFAFALEYELVLEFDSAAEKEGFHDIIETYAKKYDDRVDADGNITAALLQGSWWQPLYYSRTGMENAEFVELADNVISSADSSYEIHSFSLKEDADGIFSAAEALAPDLPQSQAMIYVNPAFYRYVTDQDYQ